MNVHYTYLSPNLKKSFLGPCTSLITRPAFMEVASRIEEIKSTTTHLELSSKHIDNTGATAILEALKIHQSIRNINLCYNDIGDDGAKSIAEALRVNQSIINIDLHYNDIGDLGATAIAEALKIRKSIINIDLSINKIGAEGAQSIAEALGINKFINIDLCGNNIEHGSRATWSILVNVPSLSTANTRTNSPSIPEFSIEYFATKFPNFQIGELWKQAMYGRAHTSLVRESTTEPVAVNPPRLLFIPMVMNATNGLEYGACKSHPIVNVSEFLGSNPSMFQREGLCLLRGDNFETGISYNGDSTTYFLFFGERVPQTVELKNVSSPSSPKDPVTLSAFDVQYYPPAVIHLVQNKTVAIPTTWKTEGTTTMIDLSQITSSGPVIVIFKLSLELKKHYQFSTGIHPWLPFSSNGDFQKDQVERDMRSAKKNQ